MARLHVEYNFGTDCHNACYLDVIGIEKYREFGDELAPEDFVGCPAIRIERTSGNKELLFRNKEHRDEVYINLIKQINEQQ